MDWAEDIQTKLHKSREKERVYNHALHTKRAGNSRVQFSVLFSRDAPECKDRIISTRTHKMVRTTTCLNLNQYHQLESLFIFSGKIFISYFGMIRWADARQQPSKHFSAKTDIHTKMENYQK
jgi:hypothetical protein